MTTETGFDPSNHVVVKYVGDDPTLMNGRLYRAPMDLGDRGGLHLWNGNDFIRIPADALTAPDPISFDGGTLTVLSSAAHRNGVGGEPFVVAVVKHTTEWEERRMLVTMFPTKYTTAVVDLDTAASGDIRFGHNSFRGDNFDAALRPILYADTEETDN